MTRSHVRFVKLMAGLAAIAATVIATACAAGLFWNSTGSYPRGLWRLTSRTWRQGDLVLTDAPAEQAVFQEALARGYLRPGVFGIGSAPLLKRVVATAGDRVDVTDRVWVNSVEVPRSRIRRADSNGRPLRAAGSVRLPPGTVWIMSDQSELSFDARYFGPVPAALVRGRASPLWTLGR